jgi:hypothetical protein
MAKALEIMGLKLDPSDPNFSKVLSLQAQIIGNVFSTTARTDPSKMKGKQGDLVGEILERIRAEKANGATPTASSPLPA